MKKFNNTFKFLEHLVTLFGELHFKFSMTSYGKFFEWITDIEEFDSLIKLEEVLFEFDEEYHDSYELERGSSREYILQLNEEGLIGSINYEWDYSELGSKWTDQDLIELIRDEIITRLSNETGVAISKFEESYYYNIVFSTEETLDKGEFLLTEWENDNPLEIPLSTWLSLTESIVEISNNNGANTSENACQFDYNFTHDHEGIIERWSNEMELDKLLKDKESYEENNT
jgi:hypothetical protein